MRLAGVIGQQDEHVRGCPAPEPTGALEGHCGMADIPRRILIINGKGGCGKTTVATNLAATYARTLNPDSPPQANGKPSSCYSVALIDHDPQASSSHWASLRDGAQPEVHLQAAHQRAGMYQTQAFAYRIPQQTNRIIIDGHSNARDRDLEMLLKQTDVVLVPILASPIDIHAGGRFLSELLTHRLFRASPKPVGVIANRVHQNTATHDKLMHFLDCLDVPNVATFRDTPAYHDAMASGLGIVDMPECRAARKENVAWRKLVAWIESQPHSDRASVQALRSRPLSAGRIDTRREADSAQA